MVGNQEGSLTIDFSALEGSDKAGDSNYVVGGRAYFELNVFGYHLSSFTTKGFLDKAGYVEPPGVSANKSGAIVGGVIGGLVVLVAVIAFAIYFKRKNKNKTSHVD